MFLTEFSTAKLIARGRALAAEITAAQDELSAIETELRKRALSVPHAALTDGHREGRRATLSDGQETVSVCFESDLLKASFDAESATSRTLAEILGGPEQMAPFFRLKKTWERLAKDGQKFRLLVFAALPETAAAAVIDTLKDRDKNGIVKSKTTVEWTPSKTPL